MSRFRRGSRVGEYARKVGERLGCDEETLAMLESAGTNPDIQPPVEVHHPASLPMGARILDVIDSYLDLSEDMEPESALAELEAQAGPRFDADVVAVFSELVRANL